MQTILIPGALTLMPLSANDPPHMSAENKMQKLYTAARRTAALARSVTARVPAWALLCTMAAVMLISGALRGEAGIQLAKAIRICLECIGIG